MKITAIILFALFCIPRLSLAQVRQEIKVIIKKDNRHLNQTQWTELYSSQANETEPGEITTPYPTIENLAIEWKIEGDDNQNATVNVQYRKKTEKNWRDAMPLRRVPAGTFKDVNPKTNYWSWDNKFSGSILDLNPDTEYEIKLQLKDPDGGEAEKTIFARTRPIPIAYPGGTIKKVNSDNIKDEASKAKPGDIFLLAPGNYDYFEATQDGEPGKPIVFRADPNDYRERDLKPGQSGHKEYVLFDGVSLNNRKYVYLEGVVSTAPVSLFYAKDCVVRECRIFSVWGIISGWEQKFPKWAPRLNSQIEPALVMEDWISRGTPQKAVPPYSENCYIADNLVVGINPWMEESIHAGGKNLGEGIEISGPGNVICYNKVIGFRDCISLMEGALLYEQSCIDIYNNDIYNGDDDGLEVDYSMNNVRIMRNRFTNCMRGIAAAPVLGGPIYILRNVLHNTENIYQLGRTGTGYVVLHNTSLKSGNAVHRDVHGYSYLRNNLFFGGGTGAKVATTLEEAIPLNWDHDYNAYGIAGSAFQGNIAGIDFNSEEEMKKKTMEKHGVRIELDAFMNKLEIPSLFPEKTPVNLQLNPNSKAVDAGEVIPNVNDNFTGKGPDLGAYESGQEVPVYGPRMKEKNEKQK